MPIKRRQSKRRTFTVTPAAIARWREVGPDALTQRCIADDELAELLGLDSLLAVSTDDLEAIRAELEAGGRRAD